MRKSDFMALCDRAKGQLYITSGPVSGGKPGRRVLRVQSDNGFKGRPFLACFLRFVTFAKFAEEHAKYNDWLDQWKAKKNERAASKRGSAGRRVAAPPRDRQTPGLPARSRSLTEHQHYSLFFPYLHYARAQEIVHMYHTQQMVAIGNQHAGDMTGLHQV